MKGSGQLGKLDVDASIILRHLKGAEYENVDRIYVTKVGHQQRDLVHTAMNIWVPQRTRFSLTG